MILIVYRSRRAIVRPGDGYTPAAWTEYGYAPGPAEHRRGATGWIRYRSAAEPIRIRSPLGTLGLDAEALYGRAAAGLDGLSIEGGEGTDVARRRDDGPTLFGADLPAPATASAYPRAAAPKARASGGGGPSPGGPGPAAAPPWEPPANVATAAPPAILARAAHADLAALRPVVAELAAEVLGAERARWEERIAAATAYAERMAADRNRLMVALARARAQLGTAIAADDEREYSAGVMTARAILEGATEDGGKETAA